MPGGGWFGGRGAAGPSRFPDPLRRVRSTCLPLSTRVSGGLSSPAVCWFVSRRGGQSPGSNLKDIIVFIFYF